MLFKNIKFSKYELFPNGSNPLISISGKSHVFLYYNFRNCLVVKAGCGGILDLIKPLQDYWGV
jgi:hypothetical protein